jgi:hypothetical protein
MDINVPIALVSLIVGAISGELLHSELLGGVIGFAFFAALMVVVNRVFDSHAHAEMALREAQQLLREAQSVQSTTAEAPAPKKDAPLIIDGKPIDSIADDARRQHLAWHGSAETLCGRSATALAAQTHRASRAPSGKLFLPHEPFLEDNLCKSCWRALGLGTAT